jgi:hypothetical protein
MKREARVQDTLRADIRRAETLRADILRADTWEKKRRTEPKYASSPRALNHTPDAAKGQPFSPKNP